MNIETLRSYCLKKKAVEETFPFGEDTMVFKVAGKMFLLTSISQGTSFNVKCEPELAVELREKYTEVQPGYHMNKKMWNTVRLDGTLTRKQLHDMIDHSYNEVVKGLPKKVQDEMAAGNQ